MNSEPKWYSVQELVASLESGQLLRNAEYQRGEAWHVAQKAGFIDSIFRGYPLPALFLHERESRGLGGVVSKKWEIVDGQQRLTALRDYIKGKFPLLSTAANSKLRLPKALRAIPAPWAGHVFEQLEQSLRDKLLETHILVFLVDTEALPDEVRDLFIRLQSGTALSRQQVRDAWPGNLGPFVEALAGKLDKRPSHRLFSVIDRRGQPSEDEDQRDQYVADRQVCAQLLRVFLSRESDPNVYPSVSANELDSLYHEFTDFDVTGPSALRFKSILEWTAQVFEVAKGRSSKAKFRRLEVTAAMMHLQDVTRHALFKFDRKVASKLAANILGADREGEPAGKKTSGKTLHAYYAWWREHIAQDTGNYLDADRGFSDEQKQQIFARDNGVCQMCFEAVDDGDAEYDHFPIPHRDAGPTEIDNGRLVHRVCHERGRPSTQ